MQRSNAREESAGLRAQVESAALQLRQLQKAYDWLEGQHVGRSGFQAGEDEGILQTRTPGE
ncbi:hypothetical protein EWW49_26205 [Pseudomonas syringae]|uniref:hypothetical protein n=1 Tax=unclassified Pseudomonas TaxID=196821 RepID=UPI00110381B9|nr:MULTISPECIES: hypothetical protein [unclassified Pseudomonas]TFZ34314.1 hypothetical protein EWW49_26205 [Pseudomonas syringae]